MPFVFMLFQVAYQILIERLSGFYPLSTGFTQALRPMLSLVELKRGRVLVDRGKRQQMVWLLCRGHAKEVSASEVQVKGRASWFWFAGDFLFSYPGFFSQEPAIASIELVEDSVLLEISYVDFMALREGFAEVPLLVEKIRGHYERLRVGHAADLVSLSARERYLKFHSEHKSLFNVAKQKDIAAFLGIRDDGFHRYYKLLSL